MHIGNTFKKVSNYEYERVPSSAAMFPGYLSWWGISLRQWYKKDARREAELKVYCENCNKLGYPANCNVDKCPRKYMNKAGYLKEPPESRYGNVEFILSWSDIMESYKQSRTDCEVQDINLLKAGTLRYRCEICYVVMVTMYDDDLPGFNALECTDKLVTDGQGDPFFRIKHPFSPISWENLVFAFYFPRPEQIFRCPKEWVSVKKDVVHNPKDCLTKWDCPLTRQN